MSSSPKSEGPELRSRLPTFLRQRMQEEQARRSAPAAAATSTTTTTTTETAAPIPPPTRRWNLLKDLLPQLQTRKPYQQSTVAVVPRVMEVPRGMWLRYLQKCLLFPQKSPSPSPSLASSSCPHRRTAFSPQRQS